jgi:signal transduction histidine kinase
MKINYRFGAFGSGAFRFALVLALVFASGSALLLWAVQRQIGGYATEATKAMLSNESAVLAGEYRELGFSGLTDALARHRSVGGEAQFSYLLVDRRGKRLFGDLPASAAHLGWGQIKEQEPDGSPEILQRLGTRLPDGLTLVVATDAFDISDMQQRLFGFTLLSGIVITLFALAGGYLAGREFLRRLDRVNRTVEHIVEGDQSKRLPNIGMAPEFNQLTRNLNHMLDRNAAAMDALKQVSTAIAHDLRTPLTRLRQSLDLARETEVSNRVAIDDAIAQTEGILATFQALLRIGMLEGGVGRKHFARVDLSEVMDRVTQAYEPVAEDTSHQLAGQHQAGIYVEGDATLLAQMFSNLIENAIVHTPAGSRIVTKLVGEGPSAIASVCDSGPGVAEADRERIFRKFYRGESSRNTPGAGLGLSLVAAVADLHRAAYRVLPSRGGFCIEVTFSRSNWGARSAE